MVVAAAFNSAPYHDGTWRMGDTVQAFYTSTQHGSDCLAS